MSATGRHQQALQALTQRYDLNEETATKLACLLELLARDPQAPTTVREPDQAIKDHLADSLVALEETFGPIAPVVEIESLDEAIRLTNASPYGLLSAIFTRDLAKGLRFADEVRTGWVNINDSSNYWESHLPFGGRAGTASGIGRVGGSGPMESFTELQTVVIS